MEEVCANIFTSPRLPLLFSLPVESIQGFANLLLMQLQDIYSLLNESSWTSFLRPGLAADISGYRVHPTGARSLLEALEIMRQRELQRAKQQQPGHESFFNELGMIDGKLSTDHPLFGTNAFSWPVVVCWRTGQAVVGGHKRMHKMLRAFANNRDGIIVQSEAQNKAEERAKLTRYVELSFISCLRYRVGRLYASLREPHKAVSPHEDDTLEWFNETSNRSAYGRAPR